MDSSNSDKENENRRERKKTKTRPPPLEKKEVVKSSRIPVPDSLHFNGAREIYLADLQEKVYIDDEDDEFEEPGRRRRRYHRRRTSRSQRIRDDGVFEDDEEDSDYGPPGILHERGPRRLSRRPSSEFGASSIELLGPSETLETDESDGSGELMEGGDSDANSKFSRFPEKKVIGKKPVKSERKPREDEGEEDNEERGRGGRSDRKEERFPSSTERKRDKQWERVDAKKKGASKDRTRQKGTADHAAEELERLLEKDKKMGSRSPSKSPSKKKYESDKSPKRYDRYEEVSPRRRKSSVVPMEKKSDSGASPRRSSRTTSPQRSPKRTASPKRYDRYDEVSPRRRKSSVAPMDKKGDIGMSPRRSSRTTSPQRSPKRTSSPKRYSVTSTTKKASRATSPTSRSPAKDKDKRGDEDSGSRRSSQQPSRRPSKALEGPPGLAVKDTSGDKWRVSPNRRSSREASSTRSKRSDSDVPIKVGRRPPPPKTNPTAPRCDSVVNLNDMSEGKMTEDALRDSAAGLRLLQLCQSGDWHGVDGHLRYFEKRVKSGAIADGRPLATLKDEKTGWTPLMYAIRDSRIPMIDRMLDLGCDINDKNKEGFTPIFIGALHAREEVIKYLLEDEADPFVVTDPGKQNILHVACSRKSGNTAAIVKILLDVLPKEARLDKDANGDIPLFIATRTGLRLACQELLRFFAQEQLTSKGPPPQEDTPLIMASRNKDVETIRVLTDAGADVNKTNGQGQTPLHIAAEVGDENLCKFFYLCKANPHLTDNEDRTPIFLAAMNGNTQLVDLLADKFKVSVFERAKDGSTLMHIASHHGHPETAMALFRKGVPLQMPNKVNDLHM